MLKFTCECGHDKFKFSMEENLYHETLPRKTFPSHLNLVMFRNSDNSDARSYQVTCAKCGIYWDSKTLTELRDLLVKAGVLK